MIIKDDTILYLGNGKYSSIFSVRKIEDGNIYITEECDEYFNALLSKEEAIQHFEEIIKWIKEN